MLRVGVRWEDLEWRDQLDVVESVLADSQGSIDRTLDAIDDQIAEMFPEEKTWGASPGAQRAQAAAESQWSAIPHVGRTPGDEPPAAAARAEPPAQPRQVVRSGHPMEAALFVMIGKALMAIPRPPPPPTIIPE